MERYILLFIQDHMRNIIMNPIMIFITHLGDSGFIWILLAIGFFCFKKTRKIGCMILISLLLSFIINNLFLKNFIMRVRPYEAIHSLTRLIETQSDYSFPSGHSASSFAAAVVIFKMIKNRFGILAIVLALLISLSRLYVGVHYPSDVLFGILSGSCIAYLTVYLFTKYSIEI